MYCSYNKARYTAASTTKVYIQDEYMKILVPHEYMKILVENDVVSEGVKLSMYVRFGQLGVFKHYDIKIKHDMC